MDEITSSFPIEGVTLTDDEGKKYHILKPVKNIYGQKQSGRI
jgi:hypothetical protein